MHIEFTEGEDKITLEGPTKDMQMVQSQMEAIVTDLVRMITLWYQVTHKGHTLWGILNHRAQLAASSQLVVPLCLCEEL